jgi:hypothetical protein
MRKHLPIRAVRLRNLDRMQLVIAAELVILDRSHLICLDSLSRASVYM